MSESVPAPSPGPETNPAFAATRWSIVLGARHDSDHGRAALEQLCATYWRPIYASLRRRGHTPADAEDLTQGFFVHVFESDFLQRPDPARGRFRGYLMGALRHYLGSHYEHKAARKRGGGVAFIDWESIHAEQECASADDGSIDPATAFDCSWALTLLDAALRRLESEQSEAGRQRQFTVLKPFLATAAARGDYDRVAAELGTTRTNVAVWVHRLHQRYAELVKLEVASTVEDPADVADELRHLLGTLGR